MFSNLKKSSSIFKLFVYPVSIFLFLLSCSADITESIEIISSVSNIEYKIAGTNAVTSNNESSIANNSITENDFQIYPTEEKNKLNIIFNAKINYLEQIDSNNLEITFLESAFVLNEEQEIDLSKAKVKYSINFSQIEYVQDISLQVHKELSGVDGVDLYKRDNIRRNT